MLFVSQSRLSGKCLQQIEKHQMRFRWNQILQTIQWNRDNFTLDTDYLQQSGTTDGKIRFEFEILWAIDHPEKFPTSFSSMELSLIEHIKADVKQQ